jgi:hypothetical protein
LRGTVSGWKGRAASGRAAIAAGTPDFGLNGDDLDAVTIDATDTIANVLHAVAQRAEMDGLSADDATAQAAGVLGSARMHFDAEREGDDLESDRHGEAERRMLDLMKNADLPEPDEIQHGPSEVRFLWHAKKIAVVIDLEETED